MIDNHRAGRGLSGWDLKKNGNFDGMINHHMSSGISQNTYVLIGVSIGAMIRNMCLFGSSLASSIPKRGVQKTSAHTHSTSVTNNHVSFNWATSELFMFQPSRSRLC
jgi:hypothetical protein